jgi:hypothetical protein
VGLRCVKLSRRLTRNHELGGAHAIQVQAHLRVASAYGSWHRDRPCNAAHDWWLANDRMRPFKQTDRIIGAVFGSPVRWSLPAHTGLAYPPRLFKAPTKTRRHLAAPARSPVGPDVGIALPTPPRKVRYRSGLGFLPPRIIARCCPFDEPVGESSFATQRGVAPPLSHRRSR